MSARRSDVNVLVVDDDARLRGLFDEILRNYFPGIHVHTARDGEEAVAEMERDWCPGLVLTDIKMPNMDGEALLDWIRRNRPGVPVVAISASTTEADFDDYLEKPVELRDFLACVERWLPGPHHC